MELFIQAVVIVGAGIVIESPGCVAKTCPDFFDRIAGMGVPVS